MLHLVVLDYSNSRKARGIKPIWCLISGVSYLFFGGFYGNAEHADIFRGDAYLPWLLWGLTLQDGKASQRILKIPLTTWLMVSGAYPGQTAAFAIAAAVYFGVEVLDGRCLSKRQCAVLGCVGFSTVAVVIAVLLPYMSADASGRLFRPSPPTPAWLAFWSFHPVDSFGIYLKAFAWHREGTIFSWTIGIPAAVSLVGLPRPLCNRHRPVIAAGFVALLMAVGGNVRSIASAMGALVPLFPASDNKATIAVLLLVLAAAGWDHRTTRVVNPFRYLAAGSTLILGVWSSRERRRRSRRSTPS
jgi:hypothetical protein